MPHPSHPNLTVLEHPLIQHKLTLLRDRATSTRDFKQLVSEIAMLMAYEATKDLPTETHEIDTPLEHMTGRMVSDKKLTLVPILRAGLGMVDGVSQLLPTARVGHIGVARDEQSLEPHHYYAKIPGDEREGPAALAGMAHEREFFILDPMLATGGSLAAAVDILKKNRARDIRAVTLLAAPEGVREAERRHPDLRIYTAAVDRGLNRRAYIVPGIGDAGDRIFGTE